jgi:hypothetical protein
MPTLHAHIRTDRPERYLRQFSTHAAAMASPRAHRLRAHRTGSTSAPNTFGDLELRVEQHDDRTTVRFGSWGTCEMRVETEALIVRIDAVDEVALHRIREIVTRDLERFGRGTTSVAWTSADGTPTDPAGWPS